MLTDLVASQLTRSSPAAHAAALGTNLNLALSLQCPGRPATGHIRISTNANDGDTVTINGVVYEFDNNAAVTAGNVLVTIGGTAALSATALAAKIRATQGETLRALAHVTDTTVVDVALRTNGAALALATSSSGRVVVQDNGEEQAVADRKVYVVLHTVTAEDDLRDRVRIDTGLTAIDFYLFRLRTAATTNTELAWDGAVTVNGGVLELDNTGSTDLAAGTIIHALIVGR